MLVLEIADKFRTELRRAGRRLTRAPGFALVAIATLTTGLGINSAMFSVMDALLFRPPFHVGQPDEVVRIQFRVDGQAAPVERTHYPNFLDIHTSGAFESVAAYAVSSVSIGVGGDAQVASVVLVSGDFFKVLHTQPSLGRLVVGNLDAPEQPERVVVSYGYWQRHFAASEGALGQPLTIDGRQYVIGGIAPKTFQGLTASPIDLWLPLEHASIAGPVPRNWRDNRGPFWLGLVARLKDGVSPGAAEERSTAIMANRRLELGERGPSLQVSTAPIVPGRGADKTVESRVSLWVSGLSALVLLIASANVTNLLLVRTAMRHREYAISLSLGASKLDVVLQAVTEAAVLLAPSIIGALAVSFVFRNAVAGLFLADVPLSRELLDARTASLMLATSVVAFIVVASISLWQLLLVEKRPELLARATNARRFAGGTRRTLLAIQAALCFALLFAAALFTSSLQRVQGLDLGVDRDRTIQILAGPNASRRSSAEARDFYEQARALLMANPEVEQVALAEGSPLLSGSGVSPWTTERGAKQIWHSGAEVAYRSTVGAGYFSTVGARTLRGRDFAEEDLAGSPLVAIVNAPLARHLWPNKDALGECMWIAEAPECLTVIGVLEGVWKFSVLERNRMALYLPLAQRPESAPSALFIRARRDARSLLPQARAAVQSIDPSSPAVRAVTLDDLTDSEFRPWRLGAIVFAVMGAVALLIAAIGLYSIVSVNTTFRRKELSIRIALGARKQDVAMVVVEEGLGAVAIGLLIGMPLTLFVSDSLTNVMYETSPRDPALFLWAASAMLLTSATAIAVPIFRAIATDPSGILRAD